MAVAFSSFDTLIAPFAKKDNLAYKEIKQAMQNFIFQINSNSRAGAEPSFSNASFDLTPPKDLLNQYVTWNGVEDTQLTYKECQKEMDMINKAFYEIMIEGDASGKLFSYPIPTYNIHKRFDWDNPNNDLLWEMTGKYGVPYFANFINSDMEPEDARSMCCRLRLDKRELLKRNGGLFGAAEKTGSIGVVTLNLPRLGYKNKEDKETFFKELDSLLVLAKDSLEVKRDYLNNTVLKRNMLPAFKFYVGNLKNHFSTIGILGMNEMCENFFTEASDITTEKGKSFALEVGDYIRTRISDFQEETGNLYNFEASPSESTSYSLALKDKKKYSDIKTRGTKKHPYYTNSCHMPVNKVESIKQLIEHQNDLQVQFTGGSAVHIFLEGSILGSQVKTTLKAIFEEYSIPYLSFSPLTRYCKEHGFIDEITDTCPKCNSQLEKYQRITGYMRNIDFYNDGKKAEFEERSQIKVDR